MNRTRPLWCAIDDDGNVLGGAPFDGDTLDEAEAEARRTLPRGTSFRIVPSTPELEAQFDVGC